MVSKESSDEDCEEESSFFADHWITLRPETKSRVKNMDAIELNPQVSLSRLNTSIDFFFQMRLLVTAHSDGDLNYWSTTERKVSLVLTDHSGMTITATGLYSHD